MISVKRIFVCVSVAMVSCLELGAVPSSGKQILFPGSVSLCTAVNENNAVHPFFNWL